MKRIKPDPLSFRSLYVETRFGDEVLDRASAFAWKRPQDYLLFTNWHVVSGIHPETRQPLSDRGSTPDALTVWLRQNTEHASWAPLTIALFDKQGRPSWLVHPHHRSHVDVAALPLRAEEGCTLSCMNDLAFDEFRLEVACDVFILGFPRGLAGAGKFPIWKRGSIASEPEIDLAGVPKLLIDSATREGMSGSPVIAQFNGWYFLEPGKVSPKDAIGIQRQFLGVYSGRLPGSDEFEAQLEFVWKASLVEDIASNGIRPD